jgi:hypothetical protein
MLFSACGFAFAESFGERQAGSEKFTKEKLFLDAVNI